ncbi:hypothetical protein D3C79_994660 [compost metagenome]
MLDCYRVLEAVAIGGAHVVHADRGNGFHSRINLRRTDGKAATAADAQHADAVAINETLSAEIVDRGTEVFGIDVRRYQVTRTPVTFPPER